MKRLLLYLPSIVLTLTTNQLWAIQFEGLVREGEVFQKDIGDGLIFQLKQDDQWKDPVYSGPAWSFAVVSKSAGQHYTYCGFRGDSKSVYLPCDIIPGDFRPRSHYKNQRLFKIRGDKIREDGILTIQNVTVSKPHDPGGERIRAIQFSMDIKSLPQEVGRFSKIPFAGTLHGGENYKGHFLNGVSVKIKSVPDGGWSLSVENEKGKELEICLPLHGCNDCMIDPYCLLHEYNRDGKPLAFPVVYNVELGLDESTFTTDREDPGWWRMGYHDKTGVLELTIKDLKVAKTDGKESFSRMDFEGAVRVPNDAQ